MKTIKRERIEKSVYNVYVAEDGTEFTDIEECKKYEQSAYAVLNVKYQSLVVAKTSEYPLFGVGCDDNLVEIVKVSDETQAETILRMYSFVNDYASHKGDQWFFDAVNKNKEIISQAIKDDDVLIIGRGYEPDENFWLIGSRKTVIEGINKVIDDAAKKD